jgi:hypothetical protein
MKEIAKMLKTLGPDYELKFRMEYFYPVPGVRMELVYSDTRLNAVIMHDHHIPFDQMETLGQYGPRILEDMGRAIQAKINETWGAVK